MQRPFPVVANSRIRAKLGLSQPTKYVHAQEGRRVSVDQLIPGARRINIDYLTSGRGPPRQLSLTQLESLSTKRIYVMSCYFKPFIQDVLETVRYSGDFPPAWEHEAHLAISREELIENSEDIIGLGLMIEHRAAAMADPNGHYSRTCGVVTHILQANDGTTLAGVRFFPTPDGIHAVSMIEHAVFFGASLHFRRININGRSIIVFREMSICTHGRRPGTGLVGIWEYNGVPPPLPAESVPYEHPHVERILDLMPHQLTFEEMAIRAPGVDRILRSMNSTNGSFSTDRELARCALSTDRSNELPSIMQRTIVGNGLLRQPHKTFHAENVRNIRMDTSLVAKKTATKNAPISLYSSFGTTLDFSTHLARLQLLRSNSRNLRSRTHKTPLVSINQDMSSMASPGAPPASAETAAASPPMGASDTTTTTTAGSAIGMEALMNGSSTVIADSTAGKAVPPTMDQTASNEAGPTRMDIDESVAKSPEAASAANNNADTSSAGGSLSSPKNDAHDILSLISKLPSSMQKELYSALHRSNDGASPTESQSGDAAAAAPAVPDDAAATSSAATTVSSLTDTHTSPDELNRSGSSNADAGAPTATTSSSTSSTSINSDENAAQDQSNGTAPSAADAGIHTTTTVNNDDIEADDDAQLQALLQQQLDSLKFAKFDSDEAQEAFFKTQYNLTKQLNNLRNRTHQRDQQIEMISVNAASLEQRLKAVEAEKDVCRKDANSYYAKSLGQLLGVLGKVSGQDTSNNMLKLSSQQDIGGMALRDVFQTLPEMNKLISVCSEAVTYGKFATPATSWTPATDSMTPGGVGGAAAAATTLSNGNSDAGHATATPDATRGTNAASPLNDLHSGNSTVDVTNLQNKTIESLLAELEKHKNKHSTGGHATNGKSSSGGNGGNGGGNGQLTNSARNTFLAHSKSLMDTLHTKAVASMPIYQNQKLESVNAAGKRSRPESAVAAPPAALSTATAFLHAFSRDKRQRVEIPTQADRIMPEMMRNTTSLVQQILDRKQRA